MRFLDRFVYRNPKAKSSDGTFKFIDSIKCLIFSQITIVL